MTRKSSVRLAVLIVTANALLSGCGAITLKTEPVLSERTLAAAVTPAANKPAADAAPDNSATGLRLARLLRDQGRLLAATEVYAQLERRNALAPLELLEYASVAASVYGAQESLALFGRARRALTRQSGQLSAAAQLTLCLGLGRARLALGQTDAAAADLDCALAADPDSVAALNAKGVILDARGEHAGARALFARAAQIDPADLRVANNLALSHLAAGEVTQALRLLQQNSAAATPEMHLNLALAYTLAGRRQDAQRTLAAMMSPTLTARALDAFDAHRERVAQGAPIGDELLAASRQLIALQEATQP